MGAYNYGIMLKKNISRETFGTLEPKAEEALENLLNECRRCKADQSAESLRQKDRVGIKKVRVYFPFPPELLYFFSSFFIFNYILRKENNGGKDN